MNRTWKDILYDVAIIGGGMSGLFAAYQLRKNNENYHFR